MNIKTSTAEKQIANLLKVLGSPFRIKLLLSIGQGEACVCHLEAVLKKRQAYISQHLMILRDAGILKTRRDGKYIYYRVADKSVFDLIESTAGMLKISSEKILVLSETAIRENCECPKCDRET
ncbi:MAG: metalloregulator ArsR/SmtB family transcription factor [Anaerolineales bacterium]|nr:metalloregulator ArsR/SmtB family transcription factor [Anaerolineales bacterium]